MGLVPLEIQWIQQEQKLAHIELGQGDMAMSNYDKIGIYDTQDNVPSRKAVTPDVEFMDSMQPVMGALRMHPAKARQIYITLRRGKAMTIAGRFNRIYGPNGYVATTRTNVLQNGEQEYSVWVQRKQSKLHFDK